MLIGISGYAGSGKDTAGKMIQWLTYRNRWRRYDDETISFEEWCGLPSTVAEYKDNWRIKKFADALRKVAHIFLPQFTLEFLYTDEFKEMELEGWEYETQIVELDHLGQDRTVMKTMTGRQFLQWLGTDAIRNGLHTDAWVKALMSEYRPVTCVRQTIWCAEDQEEKCPNGYNYGCYPNWIITDVRFPNELQAVKAAGGYTIRLERLPEWITPDNVESWRSSLHESETALDNARFDFRVNNNSTIDELRAQLEQIMNQINSNEQRRQASIHPAA